jgi:hypothetical protein
MKLRSFILTAIFLSFAVVVNVQAQFDISGTINGRVISANGSGIRRARVFVIDLTTLETQTRLTNDFGYFRINNLPILNLYLVTVSSKSYHFSFPDQLVEFTAIEHNMTFISD